MPISSFQARAITGLYALTRRSGLLETRPGERLFTASYFLYKRYLEDPFAGLAKSHPGIFRGGDILDIGANIGYTASLFAAASDHDARVYAFEPEPFNFRLLKTTIQTHGIKEKVTPVHSAVGEQRGEIKLWINDHHHADHRIATEKMQAKNPGDGYLTVPITSIDEFLVSLGPRQADMPDQDRRAGLRISRLPWDGRHHCRAAKCYGCARIHARGDG